MIRRWNSAIAPNAMAVMSIARTIYIPMNILKMETSVLRYFAESE